MGIWSLRQDRMLAEMAARQRCQNLAESGARAIAADLSARRRSSFSSILIDDAGNLAAVDGSRDRANSIDEVAPRVWPAGKLSEAQKIQWEEARRSEFEQKDDAIGRWRKFMESAPPPPFLAQARYDLALLYAGKSNSAGALPLLREVAGDGRASTESGLPLFVLAQYQEWRLTGGEAEAVCSNAIEYPSLITPVILEAGGSRKWQGIWNRDEAAREFYQRLRPQLTRAPLPQNPFWIEWDGADWVVCLSSTTASNQFSVAAFSPAEIASFAIDELYAGLPAYARAGLAVGGRTVLDERQSGALLGSFSFDDVTVSEYLARPRVLYADARRRTAWFAGLIVVSAAAALVGFVSAYRGFQEQVRLSEMKSNFVASVSHELRAPIASMRLLAEGLQRGKISEEAKRKEYFGFLVQESRRLSSLIENILDFSRIEQGRKRYEFEAVDIGALVRQTVQSMRPNGAERQVEVELRPVDAAVPESLVCDGPAMQQTLINLIDNAIKHSPAGGKVTVGLEAARHGASQAAGSLLRLWVEDQGPGIPAEEHGRIFERFYRRGSELRRETQGIGIGLTIVQHIVEAHGGWVAVRSAVGQGSRFTIEMPWK